MQSLNRNGFSSEIVQAALHGTLGSRSLDFRFSLLSEDDDNLGDITHLVVADSSSVSMDSESEIHRTAKFRVRDTGEIDFLKERIQPIVRIWIPPGPVISKKYTFLQATQPILYERVRKAPEEGGYAEFPLGVFLLSTPQKEYEGNNIYRNVDAYDKLQILVDDGFTARMKAEEGERVTDFIESIITEAGITKINIERAEKQFPTWMSWEPDVSRLEVINELLDVINYEKLHVDEYGYFTSRPYRTPEQRSAAYEYATNDLSVITPGATSTEDLFSVPNEFVGVVSEPDRVPLTYTHKNENEDSPTSIPNRGRTITTYIDADSVDLETLKGTVEKAAYEQSQVYTEMSFNTAIMPMHNYNDILRIEHNKLDIAGKYEEVSWDMPLSAAGTMSHTVKAVVSIGGNRRG